MNRQIGNRRRGTAACWRLSTDNEQKSMKERLQKLIAASGLCSRRAAEEWIAQGKVTVNGGLARLGDSADPAVDEIRVDGRPLPAVPKQTTTVLLYKPRGVVTTMHDEQGRPTVAELLPPELGRLYPVGRLDQFSEGLLLMTNDGALAQRLMHPKGEVRKTYRLWVSGWHEGALEQLRRPIVLDGYRIKPPELRLLWEESDNGQQATGNRKQATGNRGREEGSVAAYSGPPRDADNVAALEITIHEGRNRQIRRMAEAAGLKTTRLKRVAEGGLSLGDLKPGQWRVLSAAECETLRRESETP